MFGQILGAVAGPALGLAGSLLGDKPESYGLGKHLRKVVSKSIENGFNPLTVLRSQAGAMPQTFHSPTAGVFDHLAQAASNIAGVYDVDRQEKAQLALAREQMNTYSRVSRPGGGFNVAPQSAGSWNGEGIKPEVGRVTATNPYNKGGLKLQVNPNQPDGEMITTRYGDSEIFSTLAGIKVAWEDYRWNMGRVERFVTGKGKQIWNDIKRPNGFGVPKTDPTKSSASEGWVPHYMQ